MRNYFLPLAASLVFACSCSGVTPTDDEEAVAAAADGFASAYFNYDFKSALKFSTPESERWLRFAASNVIQEDVDILRSMDEGASLETEDISLTSDTSAVAVCRVQNFLERDTLGRAGHIEEEARFTLNLVKRDGGWKIKMEAPLRSERQNRD